MMKKWGSFLVRICVFLVIPLGMASTCENCEIFRFEIKIVAGEGTTEPPPGTYDGYHGWENEETIQAIPAEGWHVEKVTKNTGYSESTYENYLPGTAYILWHPGPDELFTIFEVYFAKDESTVVLELLAKPKIEYDQSGLDAPSGGGVVTSDAESLTTIPAGATVIINCNPDSGYQFVRWDIYSKKANGVFEKTDERTAPESTITVYADTKAVAIFKKT
jgi:hypothetical protein